LQKTKKEKRKKKKEQQNYKGGNLINREGGCASLPTTNMTRMATPKYWAWLTQPHHNRGGLHGHTFNYLSHLLIFVFFFSLLFFFFLLEKGRIEILYKLSRKRLTKSVQNWTK
jgi:hypothetical protein